ncbi:MAG TPA: uroporphyrinogen decarboxylase family protein [Microbacteriaceae bacterium]|nr:uroporphyrinogen decarboxylase family protein [Microbacteriaceae bacterium]
MTVSAVPPATPGAFLAALRGTRAASPPVWFAGPAGPPVEAGAPGERGSVLEVDPARIAGRTVAPVVRHGADAALLAAHVAVPLRLAGVALDIDADGGLRVAEPVRTGSDVLQLRPFDPERLGPIREAVVLALAALGGTPLVGVAAAPFTLATLLIEGGPSRDRLRSRTMMYDDPHSWAALLNWCADVAGESLRAQIAAGAAAVQLVDPALGALSRGDYFKRVLPHTQRVFSHLRGLDVPIIHTGIGTGEVLDLLARAGASAVGVDRRIPLDTATERVGGEVPLLGGLDPALLSARGHLLEAHLHDALARGTVARAHIVDLGGALPPGLNPAVLTRVVELVRGGAR